MAIAIRDQIRFPPVVMLIRPYRQRGDLRVAHEPQRPDSGRPFRAARSTERSRSSGLQVRRFGLGPLLKWSKSIFP